MLRVLARLSEHLGETSDPATVQLRGAELRELLFPAPGDKLLLTSLIAEKPGSSVDLERSLYVPMIGVGTSPPLIVPVSLAYDSTIGDFVGNRVPVEAPLEDQRYEPDPGAGRSSRCPRSVA